MENSFGSFISIIGRWHFVFQQQQKWWRNLQVKEKSLTILRAFHQKCCRVFCSIFHTKSLWIIFLVHLFSLLSNARISWRSKIEDGMHQETRLFTNILNYLWFMIKVRINSEFYELKLRLNPFRPLFHGTWNWIIYIFIST